MQELAKKDSDLATGMVIGMAVGLIQLTKNSKRIK
jgi:hypothetical protein